MIKLILLIPLAIIELAAAIPEIITVSISGLLGIMRVYLLRDYDYRNWLKRDLADCESILELGCGANSPILQIGYGHKTDAIDIWEPYITMHKSQGNYKDCQQASLLCSEVSPNSYDAVVILDVLEHLHRPHVKDSDLFTKMELWAKKKVIIFTPNGFVENDKVDGDPYQIHVSAWEPCDYRKRGYKVAGATGLRYIFGKASLPKYHPYSVFAILGMLSKPLVYHKPELAWHSYAVKEIK